MCSDATTSSPSVTKTHNDQYKTVVNSSSVVFCRALSNRFYKVYVNMADIYNISHQGTSISHVKFTMQLNQIIPNHVWSTWADVLVLRAQYKSEQFLCCPSMVCGSCTKEQRKRMTCCHSYILRTFELGTHRSGSPNFN